LRQDAGPGKRRKPDGIADHIPLESGAEKHHFPGERLRKIREKRGLTLEDVETQSRRIVKVWQDSQCLISRTRLNQLEHSDSVPSIYKLAILSEIYEVPYAELLRIYGIEIDPKRTGVSEATKREGKEEQGTIQSPTHHAGLLSILTRREVEVLFLLADGSSSQAIAKRLSISRYTVRCHIQNALRKLGLHSKAEAVSFAFRHGLL
jgi:DNA-binding CsgD family transcriptional regulator